MAADIRPYEQGDRSAVVALSLRAWRPVFDSLRSVLGANLFGLLHLDWRQDQSDAVEAVLDDEAMHVWVADHAEQVVGFTAVKLDADRKIGDIYMIAVDPSAQRGGIGSLLTSFAIEWISGMGMTVAMVETGGDPGHAPARRTYETAGMSALPVVRYFKAL